MTSLFGQENPSWSGDNVSKKGGQARCRRLYPDIGPCVLCGDTYSERHHIDGNTANNEPENIAVLCRRCHMKSDGRLSKLAPIGLAARYKDGKLSSLRYSDNAFSCVYCEKIHEDGRNIVRGLCRTTCYARAYRKVQSGVATWEELESSGEAGKLERPNLAI